MLILSSMKYLLSACYKQNIMVEPIRGKIHTLWLQNTQSQLILSHAMKAESIALCKEHVVLTH